MGCVHVPFTYFAVLNFPFLLFYPLFSDELIFL
jgi:hypothetical protein